MPTSSFSSLPQRLFYHLVAALVRVTNWFMFSRIEVRGLDRVSWNDPCIVSPNHQNAFLDALLVGVFAPVKLTFLSRASVFGTAFDWVLDALHMVPIYRRRDGLDKVAQNKSILAEQRAQLKEGGSVVMFSETEHAHTYYLRLLSRGSARLALATQAETDREVQLVPVGINYYHLRRPGFKVSIVVDEPIPVSTYMNRYRTAEAECMNELRDDLADAMKDCLLVPEKTADYRERVARINRKNEDLSFPEMKRALQTPEDLTPKGDPRPGLLTVARGISLLNVVPLWGTRALMRQVDEPAFAASLKFAVGMFGLPVWWTFLFATVSWVVNVTVGTAVTLLAVLTMVLRVLLIRHSNPPHPPVD
ncbi:MAG: 1-acyl-sn-glycerol-3-phosphate acyltransferase [Salinibacter sp.]